MHTVTRVMAEIGCMSAGTGGWPRTPGQRHTCPAIPLQPQRAHERSCRRPVGAIQLAPPPQVRLRSRARKEQLVPLWREAADAFHRMRGMAMSADQQHVFVNRTRSR